MINININNTINNKLLTDSVWLIVTSSTFVLKCGSQGGSIIGRLGNPIVGDGSTKSILGGGTLANKIIKIEAM